MNDDAARRFEALRTSLFAHAYRMLGDRAEAEDAVQDAFVRFDASVAKNDVADDRAFLRATVTRLCIDRLRSARARREVYVGPWLPEPLVAANRDDPAAAVALADDVSFAFMLALERLSALERAAFLLHDVMDVPFSEIAATLGRSEDAVKQLASRARVHVREPRRRAATDPHAAMRLRERFVTAIARDDLVELQTLLTHDVVCVADGGGKVPTAVVPLVGPDRVGRFFIGLARKAPPTTQARFAFVNGSPGLTIFESAGIVQTMAFEIADDRISAIYITRNPEKLRRVERAK